MWKIHQKVLIWGNALFFNGIALTWLYTFMATDFKIHYGKFMIPVGVLALVYALGLYLLWLPCVVILLFGAGILLVFCVYLYLASQVLNPLLLGAGVWALLVIVNLAPPLFRRLSAKEGGGKNPGRGGEQIP